MQYLFSMMKTVILVSNGNYGNRDSTDTRKINQLFKFQYGLGSPEDTVGLVPDPPSNFQIPAGLQILLNDNEAQVSSTPPKRWPGIVSIFTSHTFSQFNFPLQPHRVKKVKVHINRISSLNFLFKV